MKKLLFVTLTASFVVACGGGGDGGSSANAGNTPETLTREQIEEKFNLPPEPDPAVNNATVLGVDSNNNDIRDDWERAIAFEYYDDSVEMKLHNELAKNSSSRIKAYSSNNIDEYSSLLKKLDTTVVCASILNKNSVLHSNVTDFEANTFDRYKEMLRIESEMSNLIGGSSRNISITSSDCQKFTK